MFYFQSNEREGYSEICLAQDNDECLSLVWKKISLQASIYFFKAFVLLYLRLNFQQLSGVISNYL